MLLLPSWRCAHLQPGKKDKYEDITGALTKLVFDANSATPDNAFRSLISSSVMPLCRHPFSTKSARCHELRTGHDTYELTQL